MSTVTIGTTWYVIESLVISFVSGSNCFYDDFRSFYKGTAGKIMSTDIIWTIWFVIEGLVIACSSFLSLKCRRWLKLSPNSKTRSNSVTHWAISKLGSEKFDESVSLEIGTRHNRKLSASKFVAQKLFWRQSVRSFFSQLENFTFVGETRFLVIFAHSTFAKLSVSPTTTC